MHHRADLLLPYVLVVVASFLLRDGLNGLRIRFNNTFEQKVILDLRRDLYATLQRLPLRWYDQRATGDIITRVIDDVTAMERVLIDGVEQGIIAVLQIVGVGIIIFYLNARLAAWMLLPHAVPARRRALVHHDGAVPLPRPAPGGLGDELAAAR